MPDAGRSYLATATLSGKLINSDIMIWQANLTPIQLGACAVAVLLTAAIALRRDPLEDIPKFRSSNSLRSFVDGVVFLFKGKGFVEEGYRNRKKEGIFRVPTPLGWLIVVSGQNYVNELRTKRGNELSSLEAMRQLISGDHSFGPEVFDKPSYIPPVRTKLTRYIGIFLENNRHEVMLACGELLPNDSSWKPVNVYTVSTLINGRAINRSYVNDSAIYRDPEYLHVMVNFAKDASQASVTLRFVPEFLKPMLLPLVTNVPTSVKVAVSYLSKTIEDRIHRYEKYGSDYSNREEDVLSWLIDLVESKDRNVRHLTLLILFLNAVATSTTSAVLYTVLNSLATRPEYIEPLRLEIESVVADYGWSKASTSRMKKLDSFIMETMRFYPPGVATVDYVFSSGVRVPKNSLVTVAGLSRQMDDELFQNAKTFDGFRFCKSQVNSKTEFTTDTLNDSSTWSGSTSASSKLTTLSTDYLLFGIGEHACPGRFFAANLLKISISHLLLNYDFKIDPAHPPSGKFVVLDYAPGIEDVLLFRKRQV